MECQLNTAEATQDVPKSAAAAGDGKDVVIQMDDQNAAFALTIRRKLEQFAQSTSMHGCGKVILSKRPEKRAAWLIVFLCAWSMFAYQLSTVLGVYFAYAKKTTTSIVDGGVPFPAITLCNKRNLDFFAVQELRNALFNKESCENTGNCSALFTEYKKYKDLLHFDSSGVNMSKYFQENEYTTLFLYSRATLGENLPRKVINASAIQLNEFVVKCWYKLSKCNFTTFFDPYYYNCFTFTPPNTFVSSESEFPPLSEGVSNGFSVTVLTGSGMISTEGKSGRLGFYDIDPYLSGSEGVRVAIHPPGTQPFLNAEGYDIPPGSMTSLGISLQRHERLPQPYGKCATVNPYISTIVKEPHGENIPPSEPYRKISCERMCVQEKVMKKCNCLDVLFPKKADIDCDDDGFCVRIENDRAEDEVKLDKLSTHRLTTCQSAASARSCIRHKGPTCNESAIEEILRKIHCALKTEVQLMTNRTLLSTCNCYPACDEFQYDVSYSLSKWPSVGHDEDVALREIKHWFSRLPREKKEMLENYYNKNRIHCMAEFARINVYVTDGNVRQTTESPAMTITNLISELGGQLGIWIGVSVITLSEVLEIIVTVIVGGFRRCMNGHPTNGWKASAADGKHG